MKDIIIINPWKSPRFGKNSDYNLNLSQLVYTSDCKQYKIFKEFDKSFLYVFKDTAFNNLTGLSLEYIKAHEPNTRPVDHSRFIFDRAKKIIELTSKKVLSRNF